MKSGELANEILSVCLDAQRRVMTVGHQQYASVETEGVGSSEDPFQVTGNQKQRFEEETLEDSLTELEEELLDTINWAAMAVLKLRERRDHPLVKVEYPNPAQ